MKGKTLLVIIDGLGGRTNEFDGNTCLEEAETPNLDKLASEGINGIIDPISPGVIPGSDTAHLSLFGYDPVEFYGGRGIFEASGAGMGVQKGDICFRTNFATVKDGTLEDRRAGRIEEGQEELEDAINSISMEDYNVEFDFKATTQHRGALVLRGEDLSPNISDTDPHEEGIAPPESEALVVDSRAERTAEIVNTLTRKIAGKLDDLDLNEGREEEGKLPANYLLFRGASGSFDAPSMEDMYGVDAAGVAGESIYLGVAREVGMDVFDPEELVGDKSPKSRANIALEKLDGYDFVFLHFKAADNAGHDQNPGNKKEVIERIDSALGDIIDEAPEGLHLAVTGDHSTPASIGDHTADPVPILFHGEEVRKDSVEKFGERSSPEGSVGRVTGLDVLPILFNLNNWLEKYGS